MSVREAAGCRAVRARADRVAGDRIGGGTGARQRDARALGSRDEVPVCRARAADQILAGSRLERDPAAMSETDESGRIEADEVPDDVILGAARNVDIRAIGRDDVAADQVARAVAKPPTTDILGSDGSTCVDTDEVAGNRVRVGAADKARPQVDAVTPVSGDDFA